MKMKNLEALAPELIAHVMTYLDFDAVLRCSRVCQKFKDVIEDSLHLRYMKELACCGMIDGGAFAGDGEIPLSERYTRLLLFDSTWKSLAWRRHEVLRIRGATAIYDLYGGVLATGIPLEEDGNRWKLEFRELDSLRSGVPKEPVHWSYEVGLPVLEMALDPAQDLLILLTQSDESSRAFTAHIRSLSTNTPHPLSRASNHLQYIPPSQENLLNRRLGPWVVVQILGNLVGMLVFADSHETRDTVDDYSDVSAQLIVWDWRSGQKIACVSGLQGPISFSFLNARFVMISRLGNAASLPPTLEPTSDAESSTFADYLGSRGRDQRPQLSRRYTSAVHHPSLDIIDLEQFRGSRQYDDSACFRRLQLPTVKGGARVQMARIFSEMSSSAPPELSIPSATSGLTGFGPYTGAASGEPQKDNVGEEFTKRAAVAPNHCDSATGTREDVPLSPTSTNVRDRAPLGFTSGASAPFSLSPKNRVFVVRLVLAKRQRRSVFHNLVGEDLQSPTQEYAFFIPYSTLERAMNDSSARAKSSCGGTVPWNEWGPDGCRLFHLNSPSDFFDSDRSFYPYGPRCALPLRTDEVEAPMDLDPLGLAPAPSPRFRLRVIDVNQLSVRRFVHSRRMQGRRDAKTLSNGGHSTTQAVESDTPTMVSRMTSFFEEDVVTRLPYLETRTGEGVTFDCDTAMLTEDSLITVKTEDTHYAVQIYTF